MATVHTTALIDDLDGEPADETVTFGLDGDRYEIDLSSANADRLRSPLARFVTAARLMPARTPPSAQGRRRSAPAGQQAGPSPKDVRAWAAEQGITLSDRGRIPATVIDQYREAHR